MNIRCVGVQYMRTNPERFIESMSGDSWARCLADMSQQGTRAEALSLSDSKQQRERKCELGAGVYR